MEVIWFLVLIAGFIQWVAIIACSSYLSRIKWQGDRAAENRRMMIGAMRACSEKLERLCDMQAAKQAPHIPPQPVTAPSQKPSPPPISEAWLDDLKNKT